MVVVLAEVSGVSITIIIADNYIIFYIRVYVLVALVAESIIL